MVEAFHDMANINQHLLSFCLRIFLSQIVKGCHLNGREAHSILWRLVLRVWSWVWGRICLCNKLGLWFNHRRMGCPIGLRGFRVLLALGRLRSGRFRCRWEWECYSEGWLRLTFPTVIHIVNFKIWEAGPQMFCIKECVLRARAMKIVPDILERSKCCRDHSFLQLNLTIRRQAPRGLA